MFIEAMVWKRSIHFRTYSSTCNTLGVSLTTPRRNLVILYQVHTRYQAWNMRVRHQIGNIICVFGTRYGTCMPSC